MVLSGIKLCLALIRFVGSIRVKEVSINEIRIRVRQSSQLTCPDPIFVNKVTGRA